MVDKSDETKRKYSATVVVLADTGLLTAKLRQRRVVLDVESKATKHETADLTVKSQLCMAMQVDLDLKDS